MSVWDIAKKAGRNYITPEDIRAESDMDGRQVDMWRDVLQAIEANACEDASGCAFVALKICHARVRRRSADGALEEVAS